MRSPLLYGIYHLIKTLFSTNVVVIICGLTGLSAANIYAMSEYSPKPISFLARYLNLYIYPLYIP